MKDIKIGIVKKIIFFGGGALLLDCTKEALKRKIKVFVFSVERLLNEKIMEDGSLTLKEILTREDIPFFEISDINNSKKLKSIVSEDTLGLGFGETHTFNKDTIKLFNDKLFDFMIIKLPQYRGGAHFTWQILRSDRTGCWNIQVINEKMVPGVCASGEILKSRKYAIPKWAKTPAEYFRIAHQEGIKLFTEFFDEIKSGKEFKLITLKEHTSSYYPRLFTLKHGLINWSWSADNIERFICAFDGPYAGASTFLNKKRVFLKNCAIDSREGKFHPFISGLIYRIYENKVFIASCDGAVIVKKVLDERGKDITRFLKVGQRFYTPYKYLEGAMLFKANYDSKGLVKKKRGSA